jgi:phage terminase small subunit
VADLTYKERLFVAYYLGQCHGNATAAAAKAGYAHPNTLGTRLLAKVGVRAAIDAKLDQVAMSADEILARKSEIAAATMDDFLDVLPDGSYKLNLKKAKKAGKLHLIQKLKTTGGVPTIEIHSATEAQDRLGEYHRLWKPPATSEESRQFEASLKDLLAENDRDRNTK